jgi:hypothetical protein
MVDDQVKQVASLAGEVVTVYLVISQRALVTGCLWGNQLPLLSYTLAAARL